MIRGTLLIVLPLLLLAACGESENGSRDDETKDTTASVDSVVDRPATDGPAPEPSPAVADTAGFGVAKLLPVDESDRDTALRRILGGLREGAHVCDRDVVLKAADPNIKLGFGGQDGIAEMKRLLNKDGDLCRQIDEVLEFGGSLRGDSVYWVPYFFASWPDSLDAFTHGAIVDTAVAVKAWPDTGATTIATLNHDIVRVPNWQTVEGVGERLWIRIVGARGTEGYVPVWSVESPVGYRAGFMKVGGKWRLTALLAGD